MKIRIFYIHVSNKVLIFFPTILDESGWNLFKGVKEIHQGGGGNGSYPFNLLPL